MDPAEVDGLSECIGRAIQEHLAKANVGWPWPQLSNLNHPILRVEAYLEDKNDGINISWSERIASVCTAYAGVDVTLLRRSFGGLLTWATPNKSMFLCP